MSVQVSIIGMNVVATDPHQLLSQLRNDQQETIFGAVICHVQGRGQRCPVFSVTSYQYNDI